MLTIAIILLVLTPAAVVAAFFSGKWKAQSLERENTILALEDLRQKVVSLESHNGGLRRELESSAQKGEKFLYLLGRLPEAVKQISSNLSFDELITATLRLTKDLTGAATVEIYMFNHSSGRFYRVAAYGPNRGDSVEIMQGDGLIGKAAELKTIVSLEHTGTRADEPEQEGIDTAIPILYKDSLLGAIAIGKMQQCTGNEKRFLAMIANLMAVALNNIRQLEDAKDEAARDALTGLYNRHFFLQKAKEALLSSESYDFPVSVVIFDIDHFKNYSDANDRVHCDALLRDIGRLLRANTRSTNIVARYGEEEFILLLENVGSSVALKCAENIRKLVEGYPFPYRAKQPLGCISLSSGIATFPSDGVTVEALITHAGEALYISKSAGGNRITKYEQQQISQTE
jgi:diguanylate cyclase (GGDEF)-like protein